MAITETYSALPSVVGICNMSYAHFPGYNQGLPINHPSQPDVTILLVGPDCSLCMAQISSCPPDTFSILFHNGWTCHIHFHR